MAWKDDPARRAAYLKEWREKNRDAVLGQSRRYYEENREALLEQKRAYYEANREEVKRKRNARYRANPRKVYRANQRWGKKTGKKREYNRNRKARLRGAEGSFTVEEFAALGNVCVYCGAVGEVHPDHDIPLSRGGSNAIENIVPACPPCNTSKGAKTGDEFRLWIAAGRAA